MALKEKRIPRRPGANGVKIYIRNSGRAEDDVLKPESQLQYSKTIIERLGGILDEQSGIYDEGFGLHSAFKRDNLDQFDQMIVDAINDASTGYIVTFDSARLVRNVEVGNAILKRIEHHGLQWHTYINGRLSLESEELRLKTQVQFLMDEEESRRASYRIKHNHYDIAREKKLYFSHHAPIGMKRNGSVKKETLCWTRNEDSYIVEHVLKNYLDGVSLEANYASIKGVFWGTVKRRPLTFRAVSNIIEKARRYKPILDPDFYDRLDAKLTANAGRAHNGGTMKHDSQLLRGILYCKCGAPYYTAYDSYTTKANVKVLYPAYRHDRSNQCGNPKRIMSHMIDDSFWENLTCLEHLTDTDKRLIQEEIDKERTARVAVVNSQSVVIAGLRSDLENLILMRARNQITDKEFDSVSKKTRSEITRLEKIEQEQARKGKTMPLTPAQIEMILSARVEDLKRLQKANPNGFNQWLSLFILRVILEGKKIVFLEVIEPLKPYFLRSKFQVELQG